MNKAHELILWLKGYRETRSSHKGKRVHDGKSWAQEEHEGPTIIGEEAYRGSVRELAGILKTCLDGGALVNGITCLISSTSTSFGSSSRRNEPTRVKVLTCMP